MTVVSAALAFTTVHIITAHASQLGALYLGDQPTLSNTDATSVHGYVFSTVLLLIPIFALRRRFNTSIGGIFVLTLIPATMMNFLNTPAGPLWLPLIAPTAAVLAIPLAEVATNHLGAAFRARLSAISGVDQREHSATRMIALGVTFPLVLWSATFVATYLSGRPTFWSVHVWTGVLVMTLIAGGLTGLGTYGVLRGSTNIRRAYSD